MSQPLPKYSTAARFGRSTVDVAADRPILERSDLVLALRTCVAYQRAVDSRNVASSRAACTQLGLRAR